jgi:HEAT repeat protein
MENTGEREQSPQGDVFARCAEVKSYAGSTDRQVVRALIAYLADPDPLVRWEATAALAETAHNLEKAQVFQRVFRRSGEAPLTPVDLLARMRQALAAPTVDQREAAADALGRWPQQGAVELLIRALGDDAAQVRASAARSLGRLGAMEAMADLVALLDDPSLWVRAATADALGDIGDPGAAGPLTASAHHGPLLVRVAAISALGRLPSREARQALIAALTDEQGEIRWHAARALEQIGTVAALPGLERLLGDNYVLFDQPIHRVAQATIQAIGEREQGTWHAARRTFYHLWGWLRRLR